MSNVRNPPPSEWPRVFTIRFLIPPEKPNTENPNPAAHEWQTFQVGRTRGPEGDNSIVHSVRPEIVGETLSFFVYYTVMGSETERLWQVFSGLPYRVKFDTRGSLSGGRHDGN